MIISIGAEMPLKKVSKHSINCPESGYLQNTIKAICEKSAANVTYSMVQSGMNSH